MPNVHRIEHDTFALATLADLGSVAINTSLISDADSTDDLGSSNVFWRTLYTDSIHVSVISKTSAYTAALDHVILCDASGAAFTVTLPAASGISGRVYHIKKTDSSNNAVTVDGNSSETIDGGTTATLTVQYESIMIVCDGAAWHII